jgi:hypothetical protein
MHMIELERFSRIVLMRVNHYLYLEITTNLRMARFLVFTENYL